jgi:hypothetical protein
LAGSSLLVAISPVIDAVGGVVLDAVRVVADPAGRVEFAMLAGKMPGVPRIGLEVVDVRDLALFIYRWGVGSR